MARQAVKVVHWQHIIGNDLDEIKDIMKTLDDLAKYGRTSRQIPAEALENYRKKMWQCRQEGWYPRYRNGDIVWMHLIPPADYDQAQESDSNLDTRNLIRDYIAKRDIIHIDRDYQDNVEDEYYGGHA
jgi:hypothetical protein